MLKATTKLKLIVDMAKYLAERYGADGWTALEETRLEEALSQLEDVSESRVRRDNA